MSKNETRLEFNRAFFNKVMRSPEIQAMQQRKAEAALAAAQASAPYDTGDYHDGLKIGKREGRSRTTYIVEGQDPKTLLIESKTGNLVRALGRARSVY